MVVRDSSHIRRTLWVIVAALIAAVGATHPLSPGRSPHPVDRLVHAAASFGERDIAPRISGGFSWAPLRSAAHGASDDNPPDRAALKTAAADLVRDRRADPSPVARHALALYQLLVGDPRKAANEIDVLTKTQPDAAMWNDLAAALFVVAIREDDPSRLASALAAADAALEIDPAFPEARFNRALILESLGLRDPARDEWQAYLRLDPGSGWSLEARWHIVELSPEESFADRFTQRYAYFLANPREARALARSHPQEARVAGKEEILAKWGNALITGDGTQASRHLALAREIGAELVRNGGDEMLDALVDSIESATPAQRAALARAHVQFRQGRQLYRERELEAAERALRAAAKEFARGNSNGALMARAFLANTMYEELRISESNEELQRVLAEAGLRFPALRAGVLWQLGGVAFASSRWGESLEAFRASVSLFERLGERNYAAIVRGLLADVYARIGRPDDAWRHRAMALRELGRRPSFRLHQAIDAVTQAALADDDWAVAISFLGLDIYLAERMGDMQVTIEARLRRAELKVRQYQRAAAETDLREAQRLIARLQDPADRRHYGANANAVEAALSGNPATAAALLTDSIEFHRTVGRRMHLPSLYMLRGRAHRAMKNEVKAADDFEAGVAELESHRTSLADGQDRWGVFHAADNLFSSAISLALDQGDPQRAFAYAERERARGLLDALGASWRPVTPSDIPDGTVVVEYATQENALVIFILDARGVRAVRQGTARETLRREIRAFNEAMASSEGVRMLETGRALYRRLLEPVERDLMGAKHIAFVPDPRLGNLPFAALRDSTGRFLVESHALTIEPSAAIFTRLHRPSPTAADRHVLIVTGDEGPGVLTFASGEASAIATEYGRVSRLSREAATVEAFARHAAAADVIHFVGHGVASTGPRDSGYLLLHSDDADEGRLDVKRIASLRLPRTSLVVLAACATAAGEIRSTEGTISVARAFLAAGVPSVVATLQPIADDAAAEFFPRFHRHVARGLSPAEALRQTQLEWIGRGYDAVALWAAVQVIGE